MIIDSITKIDSLPNPSLGLLPAVHDASVQSYTTGNLPAVAAGQVIRNDGEKALSLPAYASWPTQKVAVGKYAACDGRFWYPARRYKETNSYYPLAFERTLFTVAFTAQSLALGSTFTLKRAIMVRAFNNTTDAVWNIVWEIGMRTSQTSPAPIGPNLEGYTWKTPLIDQQMPVTDLVSSHVFGLTLRRRISGSEDVWLGDILRYEKLVGAPQEALPDNTDFVLRIRLSCFDTQNDVSDPKGYVAYFCTDPEKAAKSGGGE